MTRRQMLTAAGASVLKAASGPPAIRLGLVGLVHGHVKGFFSALAGSPGMTLVGISESNVAVSARHKKERGFADSLMFSGCEEMLDRAKPEAVVLFTDTFDHRKVVEACAPRKIHCMMEKPLAVSVEHGRSIAAAARRNGIHVLVNYETTWYANNQLVEEIVRDQKKLGELRRIVVRDGHKGPKEIGVEPEFLEFLTDPLRNGGGALYDFGCYGANLITWLNANRRPLTVTSVTQRLKPAIYQRVEDEATTILTYPGMTGIIEASWNWPVSRKDMEVYGERGYFITVKADGARFRLEGRAEEQLTAKPLPTSQRDSLSYFAAVIRGLESPDGLSGLENNLIVNEILDAARRSAATGRTVRLTPGAAPV